MSVLRYLLDRGSFYREVPMHTGGITDDGVKGITIDTKKYVRSKKSGVFDSNELGIYSNGLDMAAKINSRFALAYVKEIVLDVDGGGDITVNAAMTVPAGKLLRIKSGTKIIGTGTITGKIDAPDTAEIFATTLNLNSVEPVRGYFPVTWLGMKGDGTTDNATVFSKLSANTKIKEVRFNLPKGSSILYNTSSLSFAGKILNFINENKITGTGTLVSATFKAPYDFQILDTTLTLTYPRSATGKFSVKWLGAKGDNVTDDGPIFLKFATIANWSPLTVLIPNTGTQSQYVMNSTIVSNNNNANRVWEFETGAIIKGTGTLNGITIKAHPRYKIFENTLTLIDIRPDNGRFSTMWVGAGFGTSNTTDDTLAVQKAQNAVDERWKLYFPSSTYYLAGPVIISETVGDGRRTILKPTATAPANSPVLRVGRHVAQGDVGLADITDLVIDGNSTNYGVEFNNGGNNDLYAGRWRFKNVHFSACVRSVNKPRGNFGNIFDGCAFSGNASTQYHMYAQDEVAMHSGLDKFFNCRFYGARKAAIYITDDEGGGTRFQDCVFEYNYGFCVFIKAGGVNHHMAPVVFDNCWLEGNAYGEVNAFDDAGGVDINGEVFTTPYEFHFERCNSVKMTNTGLGRIRAIGSNVFIDTVASGTLGGSYIHADADSVIVNKSEFGFGTKGNNYSFDKVAVATPTTIARVKGSFPSFISAPAANVRTSLPLTTLTGLTNSGTFTKTIVDDSPLYNKCLELSNFTASGYLNQATYTASAVGKYVVCAIGVKLVSGTKAYIYDANAGRILIEEKDLGVWRYHYTIFKATDTAARTLHFDATANAGSVIRLSCYQAIEFDTRQAAYEFIQQATFASTLANYGDVFTTATQSITNKTLGAGTKVNLGTVAALDLYTTTIDGTLTRIPKGNINDVLTIQDGAIVWMPPTSGTATPKTVRTVVSETDTFLVTDETILVDTTVANVNLYLAAGARGSVKKITSDPNTVTIMPASGLIDGQPGYDLTTANEAITFTTNGTDFFITNKF